MKILVIRLSAMGDAAMVVPVMAQLHAQYPEAEITVLTRKLFRSFFLEVENIKFADFEPNGRHKGTLGLCRLCRELGRFDLVADMHDNLRTKAIRRIMRLKGAKVKFIGKDRDAKKKLTQSKNKELKQLTPTIVRYVNVLQDLGLNIEIPKPRPYNPRKLDQQITELCGTKTQDQRWVGIAPFAQHSGKIYPIDKMFEVAQTLSKEPNIKLFIFGGGDHEAAIAQRWQNELQNTISIIGNLKITQELDLISNLDTIVCMDSSSMHMASLVGTPAISIWGATHHYAGFLGFGQSIDNIIGLEMECRPCSVYGNKPCLYEHYHCMNNIAPQRIINQVKKLIG